MKRSQSSKHTSLRNAASTPLVYSAREDLISVSSNARANAEWGTFDVPTGVSTSHHRTNRLLDLAALRESDLDNLRKTDPFMYYSIPRTKFNARPDITLTRPTPKNDGNVQTQSDDIRRNTSDSALLVKRRSRISCEKHYNFDEMLEEIKELQASRRMSRIMDGDEDLDKSISEVLYNINPAA
jgi:hypothetical protein